MEQAYMVHLTKAECGFLVKALDTVLRNEGLNQANNCFQLAMKLQKIMQAEEVKEDGKA